MLSRANVTLKDNKKTGGFWFDNLGEFPKTAQEDPDFLRI